jgi:hypothetical protein
MGYFEPDMERMRKVLCFRDNVRNVGVMSSNHSNIAFTKASRASE